MYRRGRLKSVGSARAAILKENCSGLDGKVNYQVDIWKSAARPLPIVPQAIYGHGWTTTGGKLQPMWFQGPLISAKVAVEDDGLPTDDVIPK